MATLAEISRDLRAISGGDMDALERATTDFARNVTQVDPIPPQREGPAPKDGRSHSPAPALRDGEE